MKVPGRAGGVPVLGVVPWLPRLDLPEETLLPWTNRDERADRPMGSRSR